MRTLLSKGSYAVLDLDRRTKGFFDPITLSNNVRFRYTLFGGVNTVIFAVTSVGNPNDPTNQVETPITDTDYALPEFFLQTQLPNAGAIRVLEYSRRSDSAIADNYFFAGSDAGLFVFADSNGNGFSTINLDALSTQPFTTGRWQKISTIPGAIADIKSIGNFLYVLTYEITNPQGMKSKLYQIPFAPSINAMFAGKLLIAESGVGAFANNAAFFSVGLLSANDNGSQEQVILGTNQGLYSSSIITAAGVPTWNLLNSTKTTMYPFIQQLDTPIPTTLYALSVQDDNNQAHTYGRGSIHQIAAVNANDPVFAPSLFNPIGQTPSTLTLDPLTNFWSDGGRRIFMTNNTTSNKNGLISVPFSTKEWGITVPEKLNLTLGNTQRFYWIHQLGASGILMAGTNNGIIALE